MQTDRYARQSFLGFDAEEKIARCTVGIVGLGGGGSHIVQQLAHIGFQRFVLYDHDLVEETNLNRLVGAKAVDAKAQTPKLHIAQMMIWGLQPSAHIEAYACRWQENPEPLRGCNIIFGCVDTYAGRDELEKCARRYLMDYIDVGMDVIQVGDGPPVIGGQIILSQPGEMCMRCLGFLTDEKLGAEAAQYGAAGGKPQVVWPNGILASFAVGIAVDLVTNWTRSKRRHTYLEYDGNKESVRPHWRLKNLEGVACEHYLPEQVGDPMFTRL